MRFVAAFALSLVIIYGGAIAPFLLGYVPVLFGAQPGSTPVMIFLCVGIAISAAWQVYLLRFGGRLKVEQMVCRWFGVGPGEM